MPVRLLCCLSLLCPVTLSFAAAPPAKVPAEWHKLIDQLGDDDEDVRELASKRIAALGPERAAALAQGGKGTRRP